MNKIICGNTLTILKTMPDESVNCVVTSPPYWGLRDYGIEPVIWDGDGEFYSESLKKFIPLNCQHKWKESPIGGRNKRDGDEYPKFAKGLLNPKGISNICLKCNAWRGSLGLEPTFELYIKHLCDIFDEVKRVLRKDGTVFVNMGDSYWGSGQGGADYGGKEIVPESNFGHVSRGKNYLNKSLCLIPQRFVIEMVNRGWILRNTIIWHKPNCMPSSAKDRFTVDFEYVYFFVKSKRYWFEQQFDNFLSNDYDRNRMAKARTEYGGKWAQDSGGSIKTQRAFVDGYAKGRNKRAVWTIPTKPFPEAHFAVYPEKLIEPMIKAGCPKGGVVLDPFIGAGTTAVVAKKQGKRYLGIEIKQEYINMANKRIRKMPELLF